MANNSTLPDSKALSFVVCTMLLAVAVLSLDLHRHKLTGQRDLLFIQRGG